MTNPLITIGITCFNAQDTIESAIKSALEQDYPNTEIIIVDDLSSDNSIKVINKFVNKDIKLIQHRTNQGVASARNTIINHARGEYISFFDDDDISKPERLSTQYTKIISYEKENGTDLIGCWASGYKLYDNGYKYHFKAIGSQLQIPQGQDLINYQLFMSRNNAVFYGSGTPSCSMMIKKEMYNLIGLYDPKMKRIEDTDFALRLAEQGGHFIGCPEELVIQSASTGHDKRPEVAYQSEIDLIQKHRRLFTPPHRYNYAKDWIGLRLHHFKKDYFKAIITMIKLFIKYPVWTWQQFWRSVPARIKHESKMRK